MSIKHFQPRPGRFGIAPTLDGLTLVGTTPLTASATTRYVIPGGFRKRFIERLSVQVGSAAPASGSALTVQFFKRSAGGDVTLSATTTLLSRTALRSFEVALTSGLTDAQLTVQEGDVIEAQVVSGGAISTQPTGGISFCVESAIRE